MNTFFAILAALFIRDVAYEFYSMYRLRRAGARFIKALDRTMGDPEFITCDCEDCRIRSVDEGLENMLRSVANENRTKKDK